MEEGIRTNPSSSAEAMLSSCQLVAVEQLAPAPSVEWHGQADSLLWRPLVSWIDGQFGRSHRSGGLWGGPGGLDVADGQSRHSLPGLCGADLLTKADASQKCLKAFDLHGHLQRSRCGHLVSGGLAVGQVASSRGLVAVSPASDLGRRSNFNSSSFFNVFQCPEQHLVEQKLLDTIAWRCQISNSEI